VEICVLNKVRARFVGILSATEEEVHTVFIAKDYDLHLEAPACEPGAEYWNATARFKEDISAVFPYLNAQWKKAIYSPGAQQLTYQMEDRAVALKPFEITISNLPDRDSATIELEKILGQINQIWMDREKLTPLHTPRKRLVAMEVYQQLPQTNCKLCGQPSCFAFATKLTVGEADVQACTPLFDEDQYAEKRGTLLHMLAEAAA
jgi:ArsR family metal-binding transcriptional regulator